MWWEYEGNVLTIFGKVGNHYIRYYRDLSMNMQHLGQNHCPSSFPSLLIFSTQPRQEVIRLQPVYPCSQEGFLCVLPLHSLRVAFIFPEKETRIEVSKETEVIGNNFISTRLFSTSNLARSSSSPNCFEG